MKLGKLELSEWIKGNDRSYFRCDINTSNSNYKNSKVLLEFQTHWNYDGLWDCWFENVSFSCYFYNDLSFINDIYNQHIEGSVKDIVEDVKLYIDKHIIKMYNLRYFK